VRRTLQDVTAHGLVHRLPGGQGKADSWWLDQRTTEVFARLPAGVLGSDEPSDVNRPHPPGDLPGGSPPAASETVPGDPHRGAEAGPHADEDEVERLAELARHLREGRER
jgi:hypothetical protein